MELPSAVVVNDHIMYSCSHLLHFSCCFDPFVREHIATLSIPTVIVETLEINGFLKRFITECNQTGTDIDFVPRHAYHHNVGRRYIGMARMPASRNTFSKPPNSQTKEL